MKPYDASYSIPQYPQPARHGSRWLETDLLRLRTMTSEGATLQQLATKLERRPEAILSRMVSIGLLSHDDIKGEYYLAKHSHQPTEPKTMNPDYKTTPAPTIETKTFIAGTDAATMSDVQIFEKIAALELAAKRWDGIANKPKKLGALIEKLNTDIAALVAYVDARI